MMTYPEVVALIVDPDSPLRRLPSALDSKQRAHLDAIRLSAEMIDVAYTRLRENLHDLALQNEKGFQRVPLVTARVFLDAWSIVDSIHRLREVLERLPGLKKRNQAYQIFSRATCEIPTLRNAIQHLRDEFAKSACSGLIVWGALTWVALVDAERGLMRSCLLLPGTIQAAEIPGVNPFGKEFSNRVGFVTLRWKDSSTSLSDCVTKTIDLISFLENGLIQCIHPNKAAGADLFASVDASGSSLPSQAAASNCDSSLLPGPNLNPTNGTT